MNNLISKRANKPKGKRGRLARARLNKARKHSRGALTGFALLLYMVNLSPAAVCPIAPVSNPNPPALAGANPIVSFDIGSIIIPMDNCYQRADKPTVTLIEMAVDETYGAAASMASVVCDSTAGDFGQIAAYSMVQKLIAAGVPVHWSIRDGKTGWSDYDIAIAAGLGAAVQHRTRSGVLSDIYGAVPTMKYAGAPFVIAAADVPAAQVVFTAAGAAFDDIDFHEAQETFNAPVFKTMGSLPKIAVLDFSGNFDGGDMVKMDATLADADMVAGVNFDYVNGAQMRNGDLISNGYPLAWIPSYKGAPGTADEIDMLAAIDAFVANGGSVVAQDDAIHSLEGVGTFHATTGVFTSTTAQPMSADFTHSIDGIHFTRINSAYGGNSATELTASDDYSDPASQWGGANWMGLGGAKSNWITNCESGYRDGVRRQVYTSTAAGPANNVDMAAWKYYGNDPTKGRIYYLGGKNWRKVTHTGFRLLLNTLFVSAGDYVASATEEYSRSSPIVAIVGTDEYQFSGSFEVDSPLAPVVTYSGAADDATFEFPHVKGHFRAVDTSVLTNDVIFDSTGGAFFDVADEIAAMSTQTTGNGCAAIDGDCRYLFTNNGSTKVMLAADNLNDFKGVFGTFTDPEATVLMERIHAGNDTGGGVYVPALGGIDRSTVAVIEPSSVIGTPRATVAYVGGLDGMLHAICADSTVAPCIGKAGRELWAFMPRSQLPNVATNQTRLDGSPKVADVFADFGSGTKGYRTVLTFQAGTNDAPVTYALDITDPTAPAILWEHTAPGGGIGAAMGVINIPTEGLVSVTFIQSSIGSPAGMYLAAVRTHDGSVVWSSTQQYPAARGQVNGSAAAVSDVPATGIPGGVTIFASVDGDSLIDTLLAPTLWGSVWALNPVDGESLIGTAVCTGTPVWQDTAGCTPLFKFVDDYHPIGASVSVYREQTTQSLRGLVVTGGFTDNDQPDSSIWAPSTINQYAVSFAVDVATTDTAIQAAADPSVGLYIDLGAGNRAYSQGVVLGNEVFITTDSAGVFGTGTNTGQLIQANLGTGVAAAPTVIANGVAAVDVSAGSNAVYTGSGGDVLKTDITGYDANGSPIENGPDPTSRLLWLLK